MGIMSPETVEREVDLLIQKVKHYLITTDGRVLDEASPEELYRALCYVIRERIMINWQATAQTWIKKDVRMIFYFSMEYLPGRFLMNNLTNLKDVGMVQMAMKKMGRNLEELTCQEYDPGLGNGGLGRLASCFLDSLATQKLPARGYGLRYQYGIFEQQLWDGVQMEKPDLWLMTEDPWEFRRDTRKQTVRFCGSPLSAPGPHGEEHFDLADAEEVMAIPYDIPIVGYSDTDDFAIVTLRLWSTKESPRNFQLQRYNAGRLDQAAENTTLTDVLYPSDQHDVGKRVRLKQEFLMVSASIQDIFRYYFATHKDMSAFPDKVRIQINDTHPSTVIAELMRFLTQKYFIPWKSAWEITQACTGYTNHTVLAEALEQWDAGLFRYLLPRQYNIIERINFEFCNLVRSRYPGDEDRVRHLSIIENNLVRMAHLSVVGAHKVNGVAALHSDILKKVVFKGFYELFPDRFINITNGVTHRRWLLDCNPRLASFIIDRLGRGWICDFSQVRNLAEFASDERSQREFLEIKKANKACLLDYIRRELPPRDSTGKPLCSNLTLDTSALFDVQVKRVHEYKRQLLNALRLIMLYQDIREHPELARQKRLVIFGGKAAAGYEIAKTIIRLICCIAKKVNEDPIVSKFLNVVYLENYNVSKAEIIVPAADLSEQISTAGLEASGTGNMKFAINGALTIGTEDGANIEMRQAITDKWWPFRFGATSQEIADMRAQHSYRAWDIYSKNPQIKRAVDALRDRSLVSGEIEHQSLSSLYYVLLEGQSADRYFVLKDLESYVETQKKVDALYQTPLKWAEYAIHNVAGMGRGPPTEGKDAEHASFSSDFSIDQYCKKVWGLTSCPIDPEELYKVRKAYLESTLSVVE